MGSGKKQGKPLLNSGAPHFEIDLRTAVLYGSVRSIVFIAMANLLHRGPVLIVAFKSDCPGVKTCCSYYHVL